MTTVHFAVVSLCGRAIARRKLWSTLREEKKYTGPPYKTNNLRSRPLAGGMQVTIRRATQVDVNTWEVGGRAGACARLCTPGMATTAQRRPGDLSAWASPAPLA